MDGGCGIGAVWDGNVVEETEGDGTLALELGAGAAHGEGYELYGPEGRKHPAEGVAFGMALAEDSSLAVYLVAADGDDLGENGNFGLFSGRRTTTPHLLERSSRKRMVVAG